MSEFRTVLNGLTADEIQTLRAFASTYITPENGVTRKDTYLKHPDSTVQSHAETALRIAKHLENHHGLTRFKETSALQALLSHVYAEFGKSGTATLASEIKPG